MDSEKGDFESVIGLEVYARIHESIGRDIELVMDPVDGYLYKGIISGKATFENGNREVHYAMALSRPILLRKDKGRILHVLVTPRYKGDEMKSLLDGQELTASFSHFTDMVVPEPSPSNVWRFKIDKFDAKEFVWVGIGELSAKRPTKPYSETPWEMAD